MKGNEASVSVADLCQKPASAKMANKAWLDRGVGDKRPRMLQDENTRLKRPVRR